MMLDDDGMDTTWYVVDSDNNVAEFASNGYGFYPDLDQDSLMDWCDSLKEDRAVDSALSVPNGYWKTLAKKGLFAYDFDESGSYKMVASSSNPIKLAQKVDNIVRVNFKFTDKKIINIKDFKK